MAEREVPGMAEAIERRRQERGLSPSAFAEAAGVTAQGLTPVRRGQRKQYQDKVKLGVARALWWPADALDRLMAGEDPDTFPTVEPPGHGSAPTVEDRLTSLERRFDRVEEALDRLLQARGGGAG